MDKMKEFLLKNKGCPMTPAATKQLLVKFIEWLQEQGYGGLDNTKLEELTDVFTNTVDVIFVYYEGDFIKFSKSLPSNFTGNTTEISPGIIDICYYENGAYIRGTSFTLEGVNKINANNGTPVAVYGEDNNGNLVKGPVSGGTQLYKHTIVGTDANSVNWEIVIISYNSNPINAEYQLTETEVLKARIEDLTTALKIYHCLYLNKPQNSAFSGYGFESEDSASFEDISINLISMTDTVTPL